MNITALLCDAVKKFKTKIAVIEDSQEISYEELWGKIDVLSASFCKIGIRESHRVALILPSSSEFIYCFFALLKINAIVSPLSPNLTPSELRSILDNLNPHAIISLSTFMEKVCIENPVLLNNKVIIIKGNMNAEGPVKNYHNLHELFYLSENYKIGIMQTSNEHPATINYTYRGVGYPLGAMLSHNNYIQGAKFYIDRTELNEQQRVLAVLPAYHVFALMGGIIAPLLSGATAVITNSYMISHILRTIEKNRVSQLLAIPSLYYLLLKYTDRNRYDILSLKSCITGGDYMPVEDQKMIERKFEVDVLQGYGLTECLPVTCNPRSKNKLGSLGPTGRHDVMIKIVDESGIEKESGETGEILVSGPSVMCGYHGLEDDTKTVLKNDWFYTGDYGYLDVEGYLYFVGRKKNIAKVGGNTVDLKEVQNVLLSHPLISDALVQPREDNLFGNIIQADIILRANGAVTYDELRAYCCQYLSGYKIPKLIKFTTEEALK